MLYIYSIIPMEVDDDSPSQNSTAYLHISIEKRKKMANRKSNPGETLKPHLFIVCHPLSKAIPMFE